MPKFTHDELAAAKEMINEALLTLKEKGLNVEISGGISYNDDYFSCKIQATKVGGLTKEESLYDKNYHLHELPKRGTVITLNGKDFKICGWNSRARKNKILVTKVMNGKKYHAPIEYIRSAFKS